jgi:D-3-phosphoglycerate dehydrogenase
MLVMLLLLCLCRPNVVCTPHLGASTTEAQEGVSTEVAEAVVDALQGKLAATAVNAPMVSPEVLKELAPFVTLAEALGKVRGCAQGKRGTARMDAWGVVAGHVAAPT